MSKKAKIPPSLAGWQQAVAAGKTQLGYRDWLDAQDGLHDDDVDDMLSGEDDDARWLSDNNDDY